ncbi:MAG TPA: hypothetical protein VF637_13955 [Sphingomicrobium sp.]|jgi:hypothetical protein
MYDSILSANAIVQVFVDYLIWLTWHLGCLKALTGLLYAGRLISFATSALAEQMADDVGLSLGSGQSNIEPCGHVSQAFRCPLSGGRRPSFNDRDWGASLPTPDHKRRVVYRRRLLQSGRAAFHQF